MNFFEDNQIVCDQQHGFRKHRSCESLTTSTVQDLASGLDISQKIDAILLDFSKAFDKVPHQRLLVKLEHYGVLSQVKETAVTLISLKIRSGNRIYFNCR